jgi:hypothetical protein
VTKLEKQLASVGKQLGSTLDQLDLDKRLSAVEKSLGSVADKVGLADRKSVLGIPVTRKRPDWGKIAAIGAAAVGVLAAGARAISSNGDDESDGESESSGDSDKHSAKDWKEDEDSGE